MLFTVNAFQFRENIGFFLDAAKKAFKVPSVLLFSPEDLVSAASSGAKDVATPGIIKATYCLHFIAVVAARLGIKPTIRNLWGRASFPANTLRGAPAGFPGGDRTDGPDAMPAPVPGGGFKRGGRGKGKSSKMTLQELMGGEAAPGAGSSSGDDPLMLAVAPGGDAAGLAGGADDSSSDPSGDFGGFGKFTEALDSAVEYLKNHAAAPEGEDEGDLMSPRDGEESNSGIPTRFVWKHGGAGLRVVMKDGTTYPMHSAGPGVWTAIVGLKAGDHLYAFESTEGRRTAPDQRLDDKNPEWHVISVKGGLQASSVTGNVVGARVMTFGAGDSGQLGVPELLGHDTDKPVAVAELGPRAITAVAAGTDFAIALSREGAVYSWGSNDMAQCGVGAGHSCSRPHPTRILGALAADVGATRSVQSVTSVSAGPTHGVVVSAASGKAYGWGSNAGSQLGSELGPCAFVPTELPGVPDDVISAVAGGSFTLFLTGSGEVWSVGASSKGALGSGPVSYRHLPARVTGLDKQKVIALAAGKSHAIAVTDKGLVYGWGSNDRGQLGLGDRYDRSTPTLVDGAWMGTLSRAAAEAAEKAAAEAPPLLERLSSWVSWSLGWGPTNEAPDALESGVGNSETSDDDGVVEDDDDVIGVETGPFSTLIRTANGAVYTWGAGVGANLSNSDDPDALTPLEWKEARGSGATTASPGLAAGFHQLLAIAGSGDQRRIVSAVTGTSDWGRKSGTAAVAGLDTIEDVVSVASGSGWSLVVTKDGLVRSVGHNTGGAALGLGADANRVKVITTPAVVAGLNGAPIVSIAAGQSHVTALDASGQVYSWGGNRSHQCHPGDEEVARVPGIVEGLAHVRVSDVTAGGTVTLATEDSGAVWAFGRSDYGALGLGPGAEDVPMPMKLPSLSDMSVSAVSCTHDHAAVVSDKGAVALFGSGGLGQLGTLRGLPDGGSMAPVTPSALMDTTVSSVATGATVTLALGPGGKVYMAGLKLTGAGDMDTVDSFAVVPGLEGKEIVSVSAGAFHCLALDAQGQVWAWGRNNMGQVGVEEGVDTNSLPVLVGGALEGKKVTFIAAGHWHSAAIVEGDGLYTWGGSSRGATGLGTLEDAVFTPTRVPECASGPDLAPVAVSCGEDFTAVLMTPPTTS